MGTMTGRSVSKKTPPRKSSPRRSAGHSPYHGGILCLLTPTPPRSPPLARPAPAEVDVSTTLASIPDDDPDLRAAILASLGLEQTAEKLSPKLVSSKPEQPVAKPSCKLQQIATPLRKRPRG